MTTLKLIALDAEDLEIVSAHIQDAVLKIGDMIYDPKAKRFAAVLNRFDWRDALRGPNAQRDAGEPFRRLQAALRFERVRSAKVSGIDLKARSTVLSLLAIQFSSHQAEQPEGAITIVCAGGGAIRLEVECIEAELKDLGPAWGSSHLPEHPAEPAPSKSAGDEPA